MTNYPFPDELRLACRGTLYAVQPWNGEEPPLLGVLELAIRGERGPMEAWVGRSS